MTKFLTKAALAATVALFATPAMAATAPFSATARIVKPLTLNKVSDLDFGTVTMGTALTSSTVVVGRSGGPASSCGANLTCTPATQTPASFTLAGIASQPISITYAAPATLNVSPTVSVPFALNGPASLTLDGAGAGAFEIGGTITVSATTQDGTYTGTINVTANY